MASKRNPKLEFKNLGFWKEDHGQALWSVSINHLLGPDQPTVFATTGSNRVTIYEALKNGDTRVVQSYADPDPDEVFYTCAWSWDPANGGKPILAAAGARGIIRIFNPSTYTCPKHFIGHGQSINELKFHPKDPYLLLSASKDHNLRLWNVRTDHCVVIFGGVEGHRDEVLSTDFDREGKLIVSCGMDHSLKIWNFEADKITRAVRESYLFDPSVSTKPFPTEMCHFPDFSTRDVHQNYVDCCRWFGRFILSKSIENTINIWKPGDMDNEPLKPGETSTTTIHKLEYTNNDIWFVRFSMDGYLKIVALGNQKGKTFLWDIDVEDFIETKPTILSHPRCTSAIRQTSLSRDGNLLICVCDDGSIWRWQRNFVIQ